MPLLPPMHCQTETADLIRQGKRLRTSSKKEPS